MVQAPCLPRSNFAFSINILALSKLLTYRRTHTRSLTKYSIYLFVTCLACFFLSHLRLQFTFQDRLLDAFFVFSIAFLYLSPCAPSVFRRWIYIYFIFEAEKVYGIDFLRCVMLLCEHTLVHSLTHTHIRTHKCALVCVRARGSAKQIRRENRKIETRNTHVNDK